MTYVEALQTALEAEHGAVYVYGALGAQTSQSAQHTLYTAIGSAYTEHRGRRDQLVRAIRDEGVEPSAAEPAYELPPDLGTPDLVTRRALRLERSCADIYAYLVANSPQAQRRWAVNALIGSSVRALAFGGAPEVLPGSTT